MRVVVVVAAAAVSATVSTVAAAVEPCLVVAAHLRDMGFGREAAHGAGEALEEGEDNGGGDGGGRDGNGGYEKGVKRYKCDQAIDEKEERRAIRSKEEQG